MDSNEIIWVKLHTLKINHNIKSSLKYKIKFKILRKQKNNMIYSNLWVISNPSFHWTTSIIMLDPESHVGNQSSIIFRDGAFNLKRSEQTTGKFFSRHSSHIPQTIKWKDHHFFLSGEWKRKPCKQEDWKSIKGSRAYEGWLPWFL